MLYFIIVADPDPDGSASRGAKMTHKKKEAKKFHVLKCRVFSFEG
jgi:hypothetical protein